LLKAPDANCSTQSGFAEAARIGAGSVSDEFGLLLLTAARWKG